MHPCLVRDKVVVTFNLTGKGHFLLYQFLIVNAENDGKSRGYDRKDALIAADMLNDRVIPYFEVTTDQWNV